MFLTKYDESGNFFLLTETGVPIDEDLSPEGYREIARTHLIEPTNEAFGRPFVWTVPALAGKSVLVRNDKELVRVNLGR